MDGLLRSVQRGRERPDRGPGVGGVAAERIEAVVKREADGLRETSGSAYRREFHAWWNRALPGHRPVPDQHPAPLRAALGRFARSRCGEAGVPQFGQVEETPQP